MMYGYSGFGWIGMVLFWGGLIWLIAWLVRKNSCSGESSMEVLRKRYAKGEITKKEFDEMKKDLS
jgi:putative membrane protein